MANYQNVYLRNCQIVVDWHWTAQFNVHQQSGNIDFDKPEQVKHADLHLKFGLESTSPNKFWTNSGTISQ